MSKVFHYNGEDFKGEVVSTKGITLVDFLLHGAGLVRCLGQYWMIYQKRLIIK